VDLRHGRFDEVEPSKEQRAGFDCGEPSLNRWLATQARQSMESRDAVTYMLLDEAEEPAIIVGYYCLSSGEVSRKVAPAAMAKRSPEPIPVVRMGRFAIDQRYQGKGLGAELLREALLGAMSASTTIGARLVLVDAIDDGAVDFYKRFGFEDSPIHPRQVMLDIRTIEASAGLEA
jgi:GNAT superfamily N-acetyltransferase